MSDRAVREAVRRLAGTHQADGTKLIDASVNSYDEASRTCEVTALTGLVGDIIPDVRLMADADDGALLLPTVGSTITIAISIFADPIMVGYSGLDKIVLMGGDLGGMVRVIDLVTRLNKIEQDNNALKAAFSAWVVVPNDGGAALKASAASWSGQQLVPTERADIENLNITQG